MTALPAEFEVQRLDGHWLVAGPTGLFAVGRSERDLVRDTERTSVLAHEIRGALSDLMPWVPFVDSLVVAHHDHVAAVAPSALACTVVQADMLPHALTHGARTIADDELVEIHRVLPLVVSSLRPRTTSLDPA